jgi:hypothetical protein
MRSISCEVSLSVHCSHVTRAGLEKSRCFSVDCAMLRETSKLHQYP